MCLRRVSVSPIILALLFATLFSMGCRSSSQSANVGGWDPGLVESAQQTYSEFLEKDSSLSVFAEKSYGHAVYPTIGKGAIGIGGAYGTGAIFEQGNAIGSSVMTQVTVGFQFGGQVYSQLMFFENKEALDGFTAGNFKLAAQASAVAVTAGASANASYNRGVAIFTMTSGGLMYEASIGGQSFSFKPIPE